MNVLNINGIEVKIPRKNSRATTIMMSIDPNRRYTIATLKSLGWYTSLEYVLMRQYGFFWIPERGIRELTPMGRDVWDVLHNLDCKKPKIVVVKEELENLPKNIELEISSSEWNNENDQMVFVILPDGTNGEIPKNKIIFKF